MNWIIYLIAFVTNLSAFIFWKTEGTANKIIKGIYLCTTILFGYLLLKTLGFPI
jgi:uncharacterized membrane protein YphA (DoxX/SURF4 family)